MDRTLFMALTVYGVSSFLIKLVTFRRLSSSVLAYIFATIYLEMLFDDGLGQSEQADALRDDMELYWYTMTDLDQRLARKFCRAFGALCNFADPDRL